MCGIAGMVAKNGVDVKHHCVAKMQKHLLHRGPDASGTYKSKHVSLSHTRLSIIDLESGGQPLYSSDRKKILIANGEIYNYQSLRKKLETEGYEFSTFSDCEVILPLYEKYGRDCVKYLRGMFAFAIWDETLETLIIARDRMGEKPIYYYESSEVFIFSSELKSLLASELVRPKINKQAISDYFYYQYIPEPHTPIEGVYKLPAATSMAINVESWGRDKEKYWDMLDAEPIEGDPSRIIMDQLEDTFTHVLKSDVPVGLSLSGGIDSSTIACIASEIYPGKLKAISAGYEERTPFDERKQASKLASNLGIDYIDVEISTDQMLDDLIEMITARDEPIADVAGYAYYSVMRKARENNVPVMLQGQGADELFWGYSWVQESAIQNSAVFPAVYEVINGKMHFKEKVNLIKKILATRFSKSRYMEFYNKTPYFSWMLSNRDSFFSDNFNDRYVEDARRYFSIKDVSARSDLEITQLISKLYLLGNGIAQCDRLSMAHSIESRLPFIDHKLVEKIIGLRKMNTDLYSSPKFRLCQAVKSKVPNYIFNRPKLGFSPPQHLWNQRVFEGYSSVLSDGMLRQLDIMSSESIKKFSDEVNLQGELSTIGRIVYMLELWLQNSLPNATIS